MLIELNEDTLQDLVSKNEKVVVQFSASWCGNCRIMKPKFKKLASENDNLTFVLVDAENSPESRKQCEQFAHLCHFRKWKIGKRNANQQSRGFDGIGQ